MIHERYFGRADRSPTTVRLAGPLLVLAVIATGPGCRSMSNDPRPALASPTFRTAVAVDPEPYVLSLTLHAPSAPWEYATPGATAREAVRTAAREAVQSRFETRVGRTWGYHMLGHVSVELKSLDPETGTPRYLLTASTCVDGREIVDLVLRQQVGFAVVDRPVAGRLNTPDEVARDIDEAAELGVRAVRLRVLLSPAAADRMWRFFDEYRARRIYERYTLSAYPLAGDGSGCTGLAVSFLDVAGLLDPAWRDHWRVGLRVPEALYGDPDRGVRVPVRATLFGPATRRWATADEPHRWVSFYDTTRMYRWIDGLARAPACALPPGYTNDDPVSREVGRRLAMPVLTVDRRACPAPTGPVAPDRDGVGGSRGPPNAPLPTDFATLHGMVWE